MHIHTHVRGLDSILKSRDITLPTNVFLVKAMVFPVVMYGCVGWTIKKAERQRIDAFELWCCRKLLRDPWTARRSNQSILKEINPEYSSEGLRWSFGHLMPKVCSLERTLNAGKDQRKEEKGTTEHETVGWHYRLNAHEFEQALGDGEGQGSLACCSPWGCKELDTEQLNSNTHVNPHMFKTKTELLDAIRRIIASFTMKPVKSFLLSLKSAFPNSFLTFQVSSGCFLDNPRLWGAGNKQQLPPDKWATLGLVLTASALPNILYAFKVRVPEAT